MWGLWGGYTRRSREAEMRRMENIVEIYEDAIFRFGDFQSRAGQREQALYFGVNLFFGILFTSAFWKNPEITAFLWKQTWFYWLLAGIFLLLFVPQIALAVRRLHDFNQSGWWAVLLFVPGVNLIFLLALMVIPGTEGENRFG